MSPGATATAPALSSLPEVWTPLPGWPSITIRGSAGNGYRVHYRGKPADLVAAGCATGDMCAPGRKGKVRYTVAGYRFWRVSPDNKGRLWICHLDAPPTLAEQLPGVPRTWRSSVWPMLELSQDVKAEFQTESDDLPALI